MLYSDESEWWIPESKEFCLICLRVGGGDLSSMSMMRHEQGKDSGPLELWTLLFACELPAPLPPTKTRCHKLLDVCGKWNPRVRVAEDPGVKDSVIFFFCRSALCDLSKLPLVEALRLTKSSATRFSWIRSKVLERKVQCYYKEDYMTKTFSSVGNFQNGSTMRWWWFKMFTLLQAPSCNQAWWPRSIFPASI